MNREAVRTNGIIERQNFLDVTCVYGLSKSSTLGISMPIAIDNSFSLLFPPNGNPLAQRHTLYASGVGDISILAARFLLDCEKHRFHNVSLGLGMKFPTGAFNLHQTYPDATGSNFQRKSVFVPAIYPGDGGLGILASFEAFKKFRVPPWRGLTFWTTGSYLINPRNQNGTPSINQGLGIVDATTQNALTNSVPDSYIFRAGVSIPIRSRISRGPVKSLWFTTNYRMEGVKQLDLFGRNDGYRQAGLAHSIEPGVVFSTNRYTVTATAPIIFSANVRPNLAQQPGAPLRQLATVAPVAVLVRITRSF